MNTPTPKPKPNPGPRVTYTYTMNRVEERAHEQSEKLISRRLEQRGYIGGERIA